MTDIDLIQLGADFPLSAPDAPFGEGGLAGWPLDLPAHHASHSDPVLAQLEAWLDAILAARAARDASE